METMYKLVHTYNSFVWIVHQATIPCLHPMEFTQKYSGI